MLVNLGAIAAASAVLFWLFMALSISPIEKPLCYEEAMRLGIYPRTECPK